jgi:hypothetical protein
MRASAVVVGIAMLAIAHARADETYAVTGEATRGGAFEGSVTLRPLTGGELEVTNVVGATTLVGRGRLEGTVVLAEVRPIVGATGVIENLGATRPAAAPMRLAFQKNADGTRWRVRVDGPDGLFAAGEGEQSTGARPSIAGTQSGAATRWKEFEGVPFVKAREDATTVHMSDPRQGQLADCYFVAGLIAVAQANPEALRRMIVDKGGGEYEVTLRGGGTYTIMIDRSFPVDATGEPAYAGVADQQLVNGRVQYELWPMMIERAYAQHRGGYAKMENGMPGTVYQLAGGSSFTYQTASMTDAQISAVLDAALRAGKPISIAFTRKDLGEAAEALSIYSHHTYVVTGSRFGGYFLYNPWGSSHPPRPIMPGELRDLTPTIQIGEF